MQVNLLSLFFVQFLLLIRQILSSGNYMTSGKKLFIIL